MTDSDETARRDVVLASALATFARYGYRKTSMEEVAREAQISRPGLYFLFSSKPELFRAAVTRALEGDLAAVSRILAEAGRPLGERLVEAFDRWAGRYVGPLSRDVTAVIEENPALLGSIVTTAPGRFEALVTAAVARVDAQPLASEIAQTLISTSIGLKHQVETRDDYLARFTVAVRLITA